MMLYIAPQSVDMTKAARDYHPGRDASRALAGSEGTFSPTGIYGDATLATWAKGPGGDRGDAGGIVAERRAPAGRAAASLPTEPRRLLGSCIRPV